MKRFWPILPLVLIAAFAGYQYWLSPLMALKDMQTAYNERDYDTFSSHIDFAALKESVKAEVAVEAAMNADESPLGSLAAVAIGDKFVDALVSPTAIRVAFRKANENDKPDLKIMDGLQDGVEIKRQGWSRFKLESKNGGAFIFERDGLSWKLTGMEFPTEKQSEESAKPESKSESKAEAASEPDISELDIYGEDQDDGHGGEVPRAQIEAECENGDDFSCEMLSEMSPDQTHYTL